MLPAYTFTVDIISNDPNISEEQFKNEISECIGYLDALKGAFDKKTATTTYYPPEENDKKGWSARCVVLISLGKDRALHLMKLYDAMFNLIEFELSHFEVRAESACFKFS
ncbi:MAG: hypothetical protein QM660_10940 [Dysgonomonas sp.]